MDPEESVKMDWLIITSLLLEKKGSMNEKLMTPTVEIQCDPNMNIELNGTNNELQTNPDFSITIEKNQLV